MVLALCGESCGLLVARTISTVPRLLPLHLCVSDIPRLSSKWIGGWDWNALLRGGVGSGACLLVARVPLAVVNLRVDSSRPLALRLHVHGYVDASGTAPTCLAFARRLHAREYAGGNPACGRIRRG